jgi:hypothetical protein
MDIANHIALVEDLAMVSKALSAAYNKLQAGYKIGPDDLVDTVEDMHSEVIDFIILMHEVLAKEHPEEPNHYKDLYYKIITVDK